MTEAANTLSLDYNPRDAFIPFHQRNTRWSAMCVHRRGGKTVATIHDLVLRASYTKKKRAKYAYVGPFRQQAKEIAWTYLKDATENIRKGEPRESDLRITLYNDATIQIYGADNPDALRGLYFDGIILDEYGDCRPSLWGEVILPCLMDRQGWAVFIGTMKGKNHFYKTLERAKTDPNWHHMELKGSESGILSPEDLHELRSQLTEAQYQQEIECNPNAAIMGTYYSDIITQMETNEKMGHFPHNPDEMVHVSADLGFTDSTAFWFWQLDKDGPILIDYHEADGKALQYYFDMLNGKGYEYADLWLPHDAKAKSLQTGRSTIEQFIDAGFPCKPVPKLAVQHGIDAARLILPTCRFDRECCSGGIEALRAYQRSWNEKVQQFSNKPLHNWASNGSDGFRYFALVTDESHVPVKVVEKGTPVLKQPEWRLEELFESRERGRNYGTIRI
jgi:phage terminase large subunit